MSSEQQLLPRAVAEIVNARDGWSEAIPINECPKATGFANRSTHPAVFHREETKTWMARD
jgi:hypothetical protein